MSEARQAQRAARQRWIASLAPVIADVRRSGHNSLNAIGRELNARGVSTFRGGRWNACIVRKALNYLPNEQSQSIYSTRNEFASRLRPIIEEIQAAGKTGASSIAGALNARGIRGINGGYWQAIRVHRLLKRLSMVAKRQMTLAEWLPSLAPVIAEVRASGHLSAAAMASELNARGVRACRGGRWTTPKLRDALRGMRRYKIDCQPKDDGALATEPNAAKAERPKRSREMHSARSKARRVRSHRSFRRTIHRA
jgi:hypothetical protein